MMDLFMSEETKEKLKGTKTEQNLKDAFVVNRKHQLNIEFFLMLQKKKAMNKSQLFLMKQQEMKKNMRRFGIRFYTGDYLIL